MTASRNYVGEPIAGPPTEIRSRWTNANLYLLYINPYDELNLKPDPTPSVETPRLWNWDVAEAFIGSGVDRITRYKEFQVSPQSEWVDLDIDREDPQGQAGMKWNSGYTVKGRVDARARIWYGAMRIPFAAIDTRPPQKGRELRIGLYRIAGVDPSRRFYAWRPTGQTSFHVPQAFGTLAAEIADSRGEVDTMLFAAETIVACHKDEVTKPLVGLRGSSCSRERSQAVLTRDGQATR